VASSTRDKVKEVAEEGKKTAMTVVGELMVRQRWAQRLLLLRAWW